jgi:methylphosphotriester-DNA--protein-cysteine methyltransferase
LSPSRSKYRLIGRDGRPYSSTSKGALGGHRKTKIYGRLDCRTARAAIARGGYVAHRVFFASAVDAIAAGYRPCAVCLPRAYATWKLKSRRAG